MAGFLDWVENGGGQSTVPWLTALLGPKKPKSNAGNIDPLFEQMAQMGMAQNAAAQAREAEFLPRAVEFNNQAQRIGSQADLNEASDRAGANFQAGYGARLSALGQDMRGVNPNSGGAMARRGALEASYAPGLVDAMNKGRSGREDKGFAVRAQALPMLAPNWGGASTVGAAGAGMAALDTNRNNMWRQEIGDITKAAKMPWDEMDKRKREAANKTRDDADRDLLSKVFGGGGRFPVQGYGEDANADYTFGFGG